MNNDNFNMQLETSEPKKKKRNTFGIVLLAGFLALLTVLVINI